ncbi:MAG: biotin transporter BioY [Deltaproteobacteria bacterium]|nr:biotin transporter BioY [Deltaproteobacteria bacterium]
MEHTNRSIRDMMYVSLFGAMTAVGAYIMIPLPMVPITLQNFFMFLAATLLGGSLGAMSQAIYILLGIIGLPVFAGGKAGLGVLLGPTGGYLVGFVVAAFVIGTIVKIRREPTALWIAGAIITGHIVLYCFGIGQLMAVAHLPLKKALVVGFLPFQIGDAVKIIAATLLGSRLRATIPFREARA